ncbi:MAG: hypothetical protein COT35_05205 [Nitrospirae bacterium CG08_land_8_20_14_0_20_52_24]|nr:MAG: hypothetical protein COT35_05205 [Nitrospirae bacterium CG08_land_8_20_14_0_20_52_24]
MVVKTIHHFINRYVPKGSFLANTMALMTGTALAQGLTMAAMSILTRIYSPEAFGVAAMFAGVVAIISVVASWRYELAVMLPEKEEDAVALVRLSVMSVILMSAASLVVIWFFKHKISMLFNAPQMEPWFIWLPVSVFLVGLYNILNYWFNRKKEFATLSISKVVQSGTMSAGQITAVPLFHPGAGGLIAGQIAGQAGSLLFLLRRLRLLKFQKAPYSSVRAIAKRYSDFPRYSGPGALLDNAAVSSMFIIFSVLFSPYTAGLYAIADRALRIPVGLIGSSVSQVFYQSLAKCRNNQKECKDMILGTWKHLFLIGIGPMLVIFLFGSHIFAFVFGEQWTDAGRYAEILSVGLIFHFVASPTSLGIVTFEKLGVLLGWQSLYFLSKIIICLLGYYFFRDNVIAFLWLASINEVLLYMLYMSVLWNAHKKRTG